MRRLIKIHNSNIAFYIDLSSVSHNIEFWSSIESRNYEPDTIAILERFVDSNTLFLDIGAADGCMTLIAAALGAQVIAYEPMNEPFALLVKNLEVNDFGVDQVVLKKMLISDKDTEISFGINSSEYLSSIVGGGAQIVGGGAQIIRVVDLKTELRIANDTQKILLKMDIEGYEYKILKDELLIKDLNTLRAKLILAIHPGFFRPYNKKQFLLSHLKFILFNFIENFKLFRRLDSYSTIYRSNGVVIDSPIKFSLLAMCGVYEFIIDFSKS